MRSTRPTPAACATPRRIILSSSRRRNTRWTGDWSSDVCSSDLLKIPQAISSPEEMRMDDYNENHGYELYYNPVGEPTNESHLGDLPESISKPVAVRIPTQR